MRIYRVGLLLALHWKLLSESTLVVFCIDYRFSISTKDIIHTDERSTAVITCSNHEIMLTEFAIQDIEVIEKPLRPLFCGNLTLLRRRFSGGCFCTVCEEARRWWDALTTPSGKLSPRQKHSSFFWKQNLSQMTVNLVILIFLGLFPICPPFRDCRNYRAQVNPLREEVWMTEWRKVLWYLRRLFTLCCLFANKPSRHLFFISTASLYL